jgi:CRISPR-associated exonuclease Cas4
MADLSERILQKDERYQEIMTALNRVSTLLNAPRQGETRATGDARLSVLGGIEDKIKELIAKMMPAVNGVRLDVTVDNVKDVFSRGVTVWVDDGKSTEVLRKGHGMQRCIVFAFLQALVMNQRGQLLPETTGEQTTAEPPKTIILAIEEPELYIHPQLQRVVYGVLKDFAKTDQVVYTSHEPAFIDLGDYHQIALVRKQSYEDGTKVTQCDHGVLGTTEERKGFQLLNSFGLKENELFFARNAILVEGTEDLVGIVAAGRELQYFKEFPEEIGYSIIVTGSKEEMPKFMKIMNSFQIPYTVFHELDGKPLTEAQNQKIENTLNGNRCIDVPQRMEEVVGHEGHFGKLYDAKKFFKNPVNINEEFKGVVRRLFNRET